MSVTSIFAPAKLNLLLAVTGRRADGFHDLVSVAVPLDFGDMLRVETRDREQETGDRRQEERPFFSLTCDDPAVPGDATNLVLRAAEAFAEAANWNGGAKFFLEKRIPVGAGLGGGSSDAVAALRALNRLAGEPLSAAKLTELAAQLGSDCALFLHDGPVVMRGRGERVEPLTASAVHRLRGRRVLVFKPEFSIATAWAYAQMTTNPAWYLPEAEAEARLAAWLNGPATSAGPPGTAEALLFNNLERVAFAKFFALPAMLEELQGRFGLTPRMSGSGSACFALLPEAAPAAAITAAVREAWGASAFVREARVA